MELFRRKRYIQIPPAQSASQTRKQIPDNFVIRCSDCGSMLLQDSIGPERLCPKCGDHMYFKATDRLQWLLDEGSFQAWDTELSSQNPLDFPDYDEKLEQGKKKTGLEEAILTGRGQLDGQDLAIGVMDNGFMMASMGTVVGEKLTRLFERAKAEELPVLLYITSGGARMQEGILSLMQMAKVTQAVTAHSEAGLFYVSVLTHPTTGGVTASFAMQADITLAEPKSVIGFAGRRVIEQTINAELSDDFQDAEVVLENGFVDKICSRLDQREMLATLLRIHQGQRQGGTGDESL